ncbi:MAG: hypothetical protein QXL15_02795 [Candidatus Korarchaeota archaeon]
MRIASLVTAFLVLAIVVAPVAAIDTSNWQPGVQPGDYAVYDLSSNAFGISITAKVRVIITEVRNNSYDWEDRIIGNVEYIISIMGYDYNNTEENVSLGYFVMPVNLEDGAVLDSAYYEAAEFNVSGGYNITVHYTTVTVRDVPFDAFYVELAWNLTFGGNTTAYSLKAYYHRQTGFLLKLDLNFTVMPSGGALFGCAGESYSINYTLKESNRINFVNWYLIAGIVIAVAVVGVVIAVYLIKRRKATNV